MVSSMLESAGLMQAIINVWLFPPRESGKGFKRHWMSTFFHKQFFTNLIFNSSDIMNCISLTLQETCQLGVSVRYKGSFLAFIPKCTDHVPERQQPTINADSLCHKHSKLLLTNTSSLQMYCGLCDPGQQNLAWVNFFKSSESSMNIFLLVCVLLG